MTSPSPSAKLPTLNQIITFVKIVLTPVLSVLAAWVATWVAHHFPGIKIEQKQLVYVFIVALAATALITVKWLDRLMPHLGQLLGTEVESIAGRIGSFSGLSPALEKLIEDYGPDIAKSLQGILDGKAIVSVKTATSERATAPSTEAESSTPNA